MHVGIRPQFHLLKKYKTVRANMDRAHFERLLLITKY